MKALISIDSAAMARLVILRDRLSMSSPQILALLVGFFTVLTIFRTSATLARVIAVMRPNGAGVKDADFLGFSYTDALIRPAYRRIAANFINHGRYGYTWGDAFGMTMRERFGNSSITYLLLHVLGSRAVSLTGYALFAMALFGVILLSFGWVFAAVATILFMATPVIVFSHTSGGGKTEIMWYGPILATLFLAFSGETLLAAACWSLLALCNLMGPLLTAAVVGPALLVWSIQHGTTNDLLLGVAPGVLLTLYRFATPGFAYIIKMLKYLRMAGPDVGALLNDGKLYVSRWPVLDEWVAAGPVTLALVYGAWANHDPVAALLGVMCFAAYYTSRRSFFLSDFQSFDLLFVAIGVAYAAARADLACLAIAFVGAHRMRDNHYCSIPLSQTLQSLAERGLKTGRERWGMILRVALEMTDGFPHVRAIARPQIPALDDFWQGIPDRARVAVETIRSVTPLKQAYPDHWMRGLWFLTDDIFPRRDIELATREFTFTQEPELMLKRLAHLNAVTTRPDRFMETCAGTGVSHIIALSRVTMDMLQANGWHAVRAFDFNQMTPDMRALLQVSVPGMVLLARSAEDMDIITPKVQWRRMGNRLVIDDAAAGVAYRIRYRYFPEFQARQGDATIPVEPWAPFDDVASLTFMQVTAAADGPLELRYVDYPGRPVLNRLSARRRPAVLPPGSSDEQ